MRAHHYRRRKEEQTELDVTTFLNLMVVLIPFLLVTAVFSRITIEELNLPTQAAGGNKPNKPAVTIEVIVRQQKLQITDGRHVTATIPKQDGKYDIKKLSADLMTLKHKYSDKEDATLLVEPEVEYEDVIHVMDAMKIAVVKDKDTGEPERLDLFPQLSLGDAP